MSALSVISIRDQGAFDLVRSLLHQGVSVRIRVSGRSMQPFLKGDELVEIVSLHARYPKIGDIILFRDQHGNPLLHRLVRRRYYNGVLHLQTKGDACMGVDSLVPADQVLGSIQRIVFTDHAVDLQTPLMRWKAYLSATRSILCFVRYRTACLLKRHCRFTG